MPRVIIAVLLAAAAAMAEPLPEPKRHFGHEMGADRAVLDWERVVSYFRALDAASDSVVVKELGKSTEA